MSATMRPTLDDRSPGLTRNAQRQRLNDNTAPVPEQI